MPVTTDTLPTKEVASSPSDDNNSSNVRTNTKDAKWRQWIQHLQADISLEHAELPLLLCCFVSGVCDSSAYNAWTCFVSMQTGNTIFLALGASNQPTTHPYGWVKSLTSILCFILGCFFFGSSRHFDPLRRGTLAASFAIQASALVVAAALVQAGLVPEPHAENIVQGVDFIELIPLAFLAFQSGGQMVTSRILGFSEVPTTVLTSVYCDLASDPKILAPWRDNIKRNRRVFAVVSLLIGGIVGGWLSKSKGGMSSALWMSAAIKYGIAISWSLWKSEIAI